MATIAFWTHNTVNVTFFTDLYWGICINFPENAQTLEDLGVLLLFLTVLLTAQKKTYDFRLSPCLIGLRSKYYLPSNTTVSQSKYYLPLITTVSRSMTSRLAGRCCERAFCWGRCVAILFSWIGLVAILSWGERVAMRQPPKTSSITVLAARRRQERGVRNRTLQQPYRSIELVTFLPTAVEWSDLFSWNC